MLAFWRPQGLTPRREKDRPGNGEWRNREVTPPNRAPGKSGGQSNRGSAT